MFRGANGWSGRRLRCSLNPVSAALICRAFAAVSAGALSGSCRCRYCCLRRRCLCCWHCFLSPFWRWSLGCPCLTRVLLAELAVWQQGMSSIIFCTSIPALATSWLRRADADEIAPDTASASAQALPALSALLTVPLCMSWAVACLLTFIILTLPAGRP